MAVWALPVYPSPLHVVRVRRPRDTAPWTVGWYVPEVLTRSTHAHEGLATVEAHVHPWCGVV